MMTTCGEALIKLLEAYGVDTVFGIPGVHTIELYRGLGQSNIRHITPRHEQGAGFMADGYARASGKPAVCFIISGPGMTNIATAMGQALQDSMPMLVISAVNRREHLAMGEGRLHEMTNQRNFVGEVARFSHTLLDPANLPKVLARAFGVFASARPGPVHIEVPLDVFALPAGDMDFEPWPMPSPPAPDPNAISRAGALLNEATCPVIVAGGGAVDAAKTVRAIAEKLDAPVVTTVNAKGLLAANHALAVGGSASLTPVRKELQAADAVLAVGTELGETDFDFLMQGDITFTGTLIRMDIDPSQLARTAKPDVAITCDANLGLAALEPVIVSQDRRGKQRTETLRTGINDQRDKRYEAVFEIIHDVLPDAVIAGDSCQPTYYALLFCDAPAPRHYFHSASGFGTLGYAIPAAIGAKIAKPDSPVIALIGDGAAQFTIGELASAVEAKANVIFIVWNNSGYSEISRFMEDAGTAQIGVAAPPPNYVALAESFGCTARAARSLHEFAEALRIAAATDGPTLIDLSEEDVAGGRPNI
ncbi:MAG: 5-guanidino-2-oxopentanoate decarboxylase [Hyphomicrobiales bacterium]